MIALGPSPEAIGFADYQPRAADLLAFDGGWGRDSVAIKVGTLSKITHVAGIAHVDAIDLEVAAARREVRYGRADAAAHAMRDVPAWQPRNMLIESTTLCPLPCSVQGKQVDGVQVHDPDVRLRTYPGRIWLYRPTPDWELSDSQHQRLTAYLLAHVGDSYDLAGAISSASRVLKDRWWYSQANLHSLFCSALWDAALQQVGILGPEDYSVVNPACLVRTLVKIGRYELVGRVK